jgi:intein/homing endonuclease
LCGGGVSCFLAGTQVTLADGTEKPIEKVYPGDSVLSYDVQKQQSENATVLKMESPVRLDYYIITFEDGTVLKLTDEHPIYARGKDYKGWASILPEKSYNTENMVVNQLKVGDEAFKRDKSWARVKNITYVNEPVQTYNLKDVSNTNTFYAQGVLVHNKGPPPGPGDDGYTPPPPSPGIPDED